MQVAINLQVSCKVFEIIFLNLFLNNNKSSHYIHRFHQVVLPSIILPNISNQPGILYNPGAGIPTIVLKIRLSVIQQTLRINRFFISYTFIAKKYYIIYIIVSISFYLIILLSIIRAPVALVVMGRVFTCIIKQTKHNNKYS